jgi:WD40 repeat protein
VRRVLILVATLLGLLGLVTAQQADKFAGVVNLRTLSGHSSAVQSLSFSPDGRTLASASSYDNMVRLWDVSSGQNSLSLTAFGTTNIVSVAFSPEGRTVAGAARANGPVIQLWDVLSGQNTLTLKGPPAQLGLSEAIAFSPDSRTIAGGSGEGKVNFWDTSSGKNTVSWRAGNGVTWSIVFSPDGRTLAIASSEGKNSIILWNILSQQITQTLNGHSSIIWSVAFSPDGHSLASASSDNTVKLWNTSSGKNTHTLIGHASAVRSVAFSPDGRTLVSASNDDTIKLWDVFDGANVGTLKGHSGAVWSIAFSPDGRTLASGSYDQTIKLWGLKSNNPIFGVSPAWLEKYGPKTDSTSTTSVSSTPTTSSSPEPDAKPATTPTSSTTATVPTSNTISTLPRTNIRALVIGIGTYGEEDRIPKLESAESDAKKFAAALTDPKIGNISSENVESVIGSKATKSHIERRIKALANQTKTGETLIVYFSGHGAPSSKGEASLVPWDADPNDLTSSVVGLRDLQAARTAGGNLVLILDSCFSGEKGSRSQNASRDRECQRAFRLGQRSE